MSLQKMRVAFAAGQSGVAPIATAIVIPANEQRGYLLIMNRSDEAVSLGLGGNPAVLNAGVVIDPLGSFEMINGTNLDGKAVEMVCPSGGKAISYQEGDVVAS